MSRRVLAGIVAALLLTAPFSAYADTAKPTADDAVYRANLGRADDVLLLIKQGVPADSTDEKGTPLLALAAARKDPEGINVVNTLLRNGATINVRDAQGQTALFYAAKHANMDIVKLLLTSGIDYYAVDKNGDIARNIAHREGHEEIVAALDQFVKDQSAKVNQQYQAANDALKQRYKELEEAQKKQAEPPPAPPPAPVAASPAQPSPPAPKPLTPEEIAARDAVVAAALKQRDSDRLHMSHQLAFESCAFQYWSFCSDAKQSTELSDTELLSEIRTHKNRATTLGKNLIDQHLLEDDAVNRIVDTSKQRIYAALHSMPSKAYRHEFGVGKADDMEKRCGTVAQMWDSDAPIPSAEPPAPAPAARGGLQQPATTNPQAGQSYKPSQFQMPKHR